MFYDIFESLCKERGITPTKAARENGIAQGVVSMWKKRGSIPNAITLVQLADYFNTTPAYLMGNPAAKEPIILAKKERKPQSLIENQEPFVEGDSFRDRHLVVKEVQELENGELSVNFEVDPNGLTPQEIMSLLKSLEQSAKKAGVTIEQFSQFMEQTAQMIAASKGDNIESQTEK